MIKIIKQNKGFTLLEIFFYVVIFVVLSIVVINSLITMTRSYRETSIYTGLVGAGNIMEVITREVKQATSINAISSSSLKLNTTDEAGNSKTETFDLSSNNLRFLENDTFTGNLNAGNIVVDEIAFNQITTSVGSAVRISIAVRNSKDSQNRIYVFNDTAILRGSY